MVRYNGTRALNKCDSGMASKLPSKATIVNDRESGEF